MSRTMAIGTGKVDRNPLVFPTDQDIDGIAKELKLENDQKQALTSTRSEASLLWGVDS